MFRKFLQIFSLLVLVFASVFINQQAASATTHPGNTGKLLYMKDGAYRTANTNGTDQQTLPGTDITEPVWSPDGNRLAYIKWNTAGNGYTIWIMNADGSNNYEVPNTAKASKIQWLPDGLSLVFSDSNSGDPFSHFVRINIDGSGKTRLIGFANGDLSSDGNKITSEVGGMFPQVYTNTGLLTPGSAGTEEIVYSEDISGHSVGCVAWSPNGSKIMFTRSVDFNQPSDTEIKILDVATKTVTRTIRMNHLGVYAISVSCPAWSPDGNVIAFTGHQTEAAYMAADKPSLYIFNTSTNNTTKVISDITLFAGWQSTSNPMLYRLANWKTHERLFTTDPREVLSAQKNDSGWVYEGVSSRVYAENGANRTPVYRLANWITHERLFTTDAAEANHATQNLPGWVNEGIAFYASTSTIDTTMFRLANWKTHERLFTTNYAEVAYAQAHYEGWVYEGKAFYVPAQ